MIIESYSTLQVDSFAREYPQVLGYVRWVGDTVQSRIGETKEILNLKLTLTDPLMCVIAREGMSKNFLAEEILQILAGKYDGKRLAKITPRAAELITKATAYGPRTWDQLQWVATELTESPYSRRAVVYIGRQNDLSALETQSDQRAGEMPCTETWQFFIRGGSLHMTVNMRSWDMVWGAPYDVGSFVAVQKVLANHLSVPIGRYVHNAGSAHVYEQHYEVQALPNDEELEVPFMKDTVQETRAEALRIMKEEK